MIVNGQEIVQVAKEVKAAGTEPGGIGTLYGIGVGPGDPELLTLKAVRLIREAELIAVPVSRQEAESYALQVAAPHLAPEQEVLRLHFPMVRDVTTRQEYRRRAAETITVHLRSGRNVAFLTEGDPLLHSTFGYLLETMPVDLPVIAVPGVSSVTAASAAIATPLVMADERLALLPATFEEMEELRSLFRTFDTVVLLKVHRVLDAVLELLQELNLADSAVLVERASHEAMRVVRDLSILEGHPPHYLSLLIVYSRRLRHVG